MGFSYFISRLGTPCKGVCSQRGFRERTKFYAHALIDAAIHRQRADLPANDLLRERRIANDFERIENFGQAINHRPDVRVSGRFWEGQFKCQALLSEKSILADMTYVDLNPVRAKMASGISTSRYTTIKSRHQQIRQAPQRANHALMPLVGVRSFHVPNLTEGEYLELVDFTGRHWHAGKRGKIDASEPKALTKLGLDKQHWAKRVKGIGSGYWRVVGEVEKLIDKAKEPAQRTLFGAGLARISSKR
jgi:hypothetical protein